MSRLRYRRRMMPTWKEQTPTRANTNGPSRRLSGFALRAALPVIAVLSTLETMARASDGDVPLPVLTNYGENETTRSLAMGGALRALGNGTTGLFLNPASMSATRVFHLEGVAQISPEANRQIYGGSVVDSVTNRLSGGIGVTGGFVAPDSIDRSLFDVRVGLGYPISELLLVGVSGRYEKASQQGLGPLGTSKVSGGLVDEQGQRGHLFDSFTMDAGLVIKPSPAFSIGVLGQNITYPKNGLAPTTVGGGIGYGDHDFSVEVDGLADFNSYKETTARVMAGGEYLVGNHVPIRIGYRFDQGATLHSASGGLGYVGREFSLEGSVRRSIAQPGVTTVVFSVAYFLESSGVTRSPTRDLE